MKQAEQTLNKVVIKPLQNNNEHFVDDALVPPSKARFMLVPLLTMVIGMFVFMFISGNGQLSQGDGTKSVLYATCVAVAVAYFLLLFSKRFSHKELALA